MYRIPTWQLKASFFVLVEYLWPWRGGLLVRPSPVYAICMKPKGFAVHSTQPGPGHWVTRPDIAGNRHPTKGLSVLDLNSTSRIFRGAGLLHPNVEAAILFLS